MSKYEHTNHEKYKMRFHLIFSTKYRKHLLRGKFAEDLKSSFRRAEAMQDDWSIEIMEIDSEKCDHIHILLRGTPKTKIWNVIQKLKSITTYDMWQKYRDYLTQYYWSGKHNLWTKGYFCTTIGEVSEGTLRHYIESQG